ncbi:MAG: GNAT family N-acetyltransferase [Desulfobacteraceae bacterium]|nr:GNAT family N-acetyltransferase [Desulfobacteraceae bacterium]
MASKKVIRDLGNGLILRQSTIQDMEDLISFHSEHHPPTGAASWAEYIKKWTHDLMTKAHPTFKPGDFTIIVDTNTQMIVSSVCHIGQTWCYEGVEFDVGRLEMFTTHPEYRRKGLIREQLKVINQWSIERGYKLQAIRGIPFFYRQFGYELCLPLGGSRIGYLPNIPRLKSGEAEKYTFRPATPKDIPSFMESYEARCQRDMVSCKRTKAIWQYELFETNESIRGNYQVIENADSEKVGFILTSQRLESPVLGLEAFELKAGVSWLDVTPSVIRYMEKLGKELAKDDEHLEFGGFRFTLGGEHPAYDVLPKRMPKVVDPTAWYIRLPDLSGFLMHIKPILEKRLADSPAVGHTGDLKLSFYPNGVKLIFDRGKLMSVEHFSPVHIYDGDMVFPELTFLRSLFGHTSPHKLEKDVDECYSLSDHGWALVGFLFPEKVSNVWEIS